ncbi:hypothetical protein KFK09_011854 [Dendrobium nobile]|uniref:Transposase n=1 Tax=Dendrobium nobile TaxID=94219 RepID=A0A8T3BDP5_DENNO|nr:hypothetical protein KFK09_011854 [Dendrobium nobile]
MAIRDQENVKWPHPLKLNVENQEEYCHFHRSRGHTTKASQSPDNQSLVDSPDLFHTGYVVEQGSGIQPRKGLTSLVDSPDLFHTDEYAMNDASRGTPKLNEGEAPSENIRTDDMDGLLRDILCPNDLVQNPAMEQNEFNTNEENDHGEKFANLMQDAGAELYPGCKTFSKLSFILKLFHLKCLHSWTARSFDMLLELLVDAFPEGVLLPKSTYEVKKMMKAFDLGYTKIDACPNDCMLFWKDRSDQNICHICGTSRWSTIIKKNSRGKKTHMELAKIVRYFPLIPRLQRFFKTKKSAEEMIWHAKHRNVDDLLRHPADGEAWKAFDSQYPDFALDPRNIRLGLSSDGFNPFKIMSSTYSIWPILLVPYNMPPWVGMKHDSFILSTIIPGERSPGNAIDIYLQPLIQELCELWHGVQCYDAASGQIFSMRAALLWTINDFPAYGYEFKLLLRNCKLSSTSTGLVKLIAVFKICAFAFVVSKLLMMEMTRRTTYRRAKKVVSRGGSSRGSETPSTPIHPDSTCEQSQEENECSGTQQSPRHSTCEQIQTPNDGILLIGVPVRRRGRTTCIDIQNMPPGTRVHIEVNENNVPSNISESVLLGSYLGVIARDPVLAPLSFPDWRNKGLEPYKKKMLAEVESKFAFPGHIRHWILQSLGVKWRNHKTNLKAEHWDCRPIEEIMESVPAGVDATQWCHLVNQWSQPKDKERAAINAANAKKQTCPHTMGRVSSVRRQQEMAIKDRLLLWRVNRLRKDGTWSSEDANQRWIQACKLLAKDELTPEDGNVEANERVFSMVMGPEHPGRVRTQGFGVTPTRYFPHSTNNGTSSCGSNLSQIVNLKEEFREEFNSLRTEMRQFMQEIRMQHPPQGSSQMRLKPLLQSACLPRQFLNRCRMSLQRIAIAADM